MEKLIVKDIMTVNPIVVKQQVTVQEAVSLMLKHRVDGLPVVDVSGDLRIGKFGF